MLKHIPLDLSTFKTMITENYLYVDKTQYIYNLFSGGNRLYFLSRPRRFGKSLLISTLKELFLGKKELFKGLWIDSSDYQWNSYPVIHLDFATIAHKNLEEMEAELSRRFLAIANEYSIAIPTSVSVYGQLYDLVSQLGKKNKVVILIDEYDKPMLDHINDISMAYAMKDAMRGMYDTIKGLDEYLRAVFVTGVTKFAKTSVFSGMNNLNDISFSEISAALLGYTEKELTHHFADYIQTIAHKEQTSSNEILSIMKQWYNGYQFSESEITVYNPFSVHYYLSRQILANYWFQSGTPTFLIDLIKKQYVDLESFSQDDLKIEQLGTFELENIPLIPLLFQTGYLTIGTYDQKTRRFTLKYPNYEVEESFTKYIVAALTDKTTVVVDSAANQLRKALFNNDLERFCLIIQSLLASIPYNLHIAKESYYHSLFHFLMTLLILETQSEVLTNQGRTDTVIQINDTIYIFELKINKKPEEALQQIIDKKYYERYALYNKPIILIGLVFKIQDKDISVEFVSQKLQGTINAQK